MVTPKFLGKATQPESKSKSNQTIKVSASYFLQRPITLLVYILIVIVTISFAFGVLATKAFDLIGRGPKIFSIQTNTDLTPTPDGLLRSNAALLEGEIKEIKEDSLVIVSQEKTVEIKLSLNFSKEGDQPVATSSSGRRIPVKRVLPSMKEGDTVQLGVEVINGETVITNIFVKESAAE